MWIDNALSSDGTNIYAFVRRHGQDYLATFTPPKIASQLAAASASSATSAAHPLEHTSMAATANPGKPTEPAAAHLEGASTASSVPSSETASTEATANHAVPTEPAAKADIKVTKPAGTNRNETSTTAVPLNPAESKNTSDRHNTSTWD
ncbi:hypothetical protein FACS189449_04170 [Alphaproteobacteria bacterium]|nr:hypothetical protein FACS189449_04170 [Alphaproteobacteria bacterium]